MKYCYTIITLAVLMACSSTKKTQKTPAPTTDSAAAVAEETAGSIIAKLNHIDFSTFTGKIDVTYKEKENANNFDLKLQMKKDSLIWISATGPLGIEGARGIITKDSVKIINKLKKEYIASSFSYLQEKLGLPLDFSTLQDLLIGNPVFIDSSRAAFERKSNEIVLTSQTEHFKNTLTLLLTGYLPALSKLEDAGNTAGRSAELHYDRYENREGMQFPMSRQIKVNYKTAIDIQLTYKSAIFNEALSTPFSVPKGYKTIQ